jgi:hypothetical protein
MTMEARCQKEEGVAFFIRFEDEGFMFGWIDFLTKEPPAPSAFLSATLQMCKERGVFGMLQNPGTLPQAGRLYHTMLA